MGGPDLDGRSGSGCVAIIVGHFASSGIYSDVTVISTAIGKAPSIIDTGCGSRRCSSACRRCTAINGIVGSSGSTVWGKLIENWYIRRCPVSVGSERTYATACW